MRTAASTAETDLLSGNKYRVAWKVYAENSTGAFVDLTDLGDVNWCDSVSWDETIDEPVARAEIRLRRDITPSTGMSLAPLDTASTFNLNSTSGFAALLWPGREVKIETATITLGSTPSSSDYRLMFWGETDRVESGTQVVLTARDRLGAHLADRWVESTGYKYGTIDGRAVESVIQDIITAHTTPASTTLNVYTPASPGFLIAPPYPQERMPVMQAITDLSDLIGWYLRPMWDSGSSAFRVTFAEPSRSASTADWTFSASNYFDVRMLSVDRTRVRNVIDISWASTAGVRSSTSVTDTDSVADYGRRWMRIQEADGSPISSSSEAYTLASAILEDLKDPEAEQEIETLYFPLAQLDDYLGFTANGYHYTSDKTWGLYSIRHELSLDRHRSYFRVRGQPAAGFDRWFNKRDDGEGNGPSTSIDPSGEAQLLALTLAEYNSTNGKYTITSMVPGANAIQWKLWERDSTGTAWPTQDGSSGGTFDDTYHRGTFATDGYAVLHTAASSAGTRYAIAVGVNSAGRLGPRKHASLAISTSTAGAGAGAFSEFYATPGTSGCTVFWMHDDVIQNDSTGRYVVDLYRGNLGSAAEVVLATSRNAKTDHTSTTAYQGSYLDTDLIRCTSGAGDVCSQYNFKYRIVLRDTSTTPYANKEYSYQVGDYFDDNLSSNLL